jgi:HdeA/HdeB family
MMKGLAAGAVAFVLAAGSPPVMAQTADLTQATCAELMELSESDRGQLGVWLHGYYAGAAQRALLDPAGVEKALAAMQELCERNRATPLIGSEARALFLGEVPPPPPPAPATPTPQTPARQPQPRPPAAR